MRDDARILREIAEQNFSWEDVNPNRFNLNVMLNSNIFCPFHENRNTASCKAYTDSEKDIVVLWCFTEQRRYTVYDYINLIIVRQWKKYSSVYDYLIRHLGEQKFNEFYSLVEQGIQLEEESLLEQTIEYIDNLYNEHDNVIDFINCLYLEKE